MIVSADSGFTPKRITMHRVHRDEFPTGKYYNIPINFVRNIPHHGILLE